MSKRSLYLIILLLGTALLGVLWGRAQQEPRAPASPAAPVLDARRVLRAEGTDFVFTITEPLEASVHVALSEHCTSEATVTLGPLRTALRPAPVYEPERDPEHRFRVRAGARPQTLRLHESGPYILRIEPIPMAMGAGGEKTAVHVIVRRTGD